MDNKEYKKIYLQLLKNLNSIIDQEPNDPFRTIDENKPRSFYDIARRAKKILQAILQYDPLKNPDYFTTIELERFKKNIIRIYESTELIKDDLSYDNQDSEFDLLIDRLVPIYKNILILTNQDKNKEVMADFKKEIDTIINSLNISEDNLKSNIAQAKAVNNTLVSAQNEMLNISNELTSQLDESNEKSRKISLLLSRSEAAYGNIDNIKETLATASTTLKTLQDKNEILQENFENYINSSQSRVDKILEKEENINGIETNISTNIKDAEDLISKATTAMTLTGTFRLSKSFKTSYLIARKSRNMWVVISIISALISLGFVGFMLYEMYKFDFSKLSESSTPVIVMFIARFSMIPVVLGFFAFCAIQYVKQNNICEEYAHKKLLSETIISFKDEFSRSSDENTLAFLKKILEVVLRSPLNLVDKKAHQKEMQHITSLVSETNKLGESILNRMSPQDKK